MLPYIRLNTLVRNEIWRLYVPPGHRVDDVDVGAGDTRQICTLTETLGFVLQVDDIPERALVNTLRLRHSFNFNSRFVNQNAGLLDDRLNRILQPQGFLLPVCLAHVLEIEIHDGRVVLHRHIVAPKKGALTEHRQVKLFGGNQFISSLHLLSIDDQIDEYIQEKCDGFNSSQNRVGCRSAVSGGSYGFGGECRRVNDGIGSLLLDLSIDDGDNRRQGGGRVSHPDVTVFGFHFRCFMNALGNANPVLDGLSTGTYHPEKGNNTSDKLRDCCSEHVL